jgi:uncharacterized membrane protein
MRITYNEQGVLHKAFILGVLLKGLNAVLQIAGGAALLLVPPETVISWLTQMTPEKYLMDPDSILVKTVLDFGDYCTTEGKIFLSVYLLSHGIMKMIVIGFLLLGYRWAYPAMGILLIGFIVYQVYKYSFTHSYWLIWLTVLDLFLLFLTWMEYRHVKEELFE